MSSQDSQAIIEEANLFNTATPPPSPTPPPSASSSPTPIAESLLKIPPAASITSTSSAQPTFELSEPVKARKTKRSMKQPLIFSEEVIKRHASFQSGFVKTPAELIQQFHGCDSGQPRMMYQNNEQSKISSTAINWRARARSMMHVFARMGHVWADEMLMKMEQNLESAEEITVLVGCVHAMDTMINSFK